MWAAARRDWWIDHSLSVTALVASSLPEFVVAVFVVMFFAVTVFAWFPAVSILPPGRAHLGRADKLVLPVLTLVIVVTPYVFRMFRASLIEALTPTTSRSPRSRAQQPADCSSVTRCPTRLPRPSRSSA